MISLCKHLSITGYCEKKEKLIREHDMHGVKGCPAVTRNPTSGVDTINYKLMLSMPCSDKWDIGGDD
jgi:hypothetical protein